MAQEAFIRAFRSLKSFREEGRFYAWLYRIALRRCPDRQRPARWKAEVLVAEPERSYRIAFRPLIGSFSNRHRLYSRAGRQGVYLRRRP